MDLPSAIGSPRLCPLGDRTFFVSPIDLEGYGILIAWVNESLEGYEDRKLPVAISSPEAVKLLNSPMGRLIECVIALRGYGLSYEAVKAIWVAASDAERGYLHHALFWRRRTRPTEPDPWNPGEDLGEFWWAPTIAALAERLGSLDAVKRLTLDQIDLLAPNGVSQESEDPNWQTRPGRNLTGAEIQALRKMEAEAREKAARGNGNGG